MVARFKKRLRTKSQELAVSMPTLIWLIVFFVIPTLAVISIAFRAADPYGGISDTWTLDTLFGLGNPNYPAIIWRTVWISFVATTICLTLAVPAGYYLARVDKKWRDALLVLIIVPFWTNFLIRIFAWKSFLHPEGLFKQLLVLVGLANNDTILLYRPETILVVLVYTYLPFAILPVYAAAEKFDFHLLEAAQDLGANRFRAFFSVFLPGIRQGIITAIMVVLIPALGSYVIPDLVGGPDSEMIGNKIAQRTFVDRNLPHASAMSALLTLLILLPVMIKLLLPEKIREISRFEKK